MSLPCGWREFEREREPRKKRYILFAIDVTNETNRNPKRLLEHLLFGERVALAYEPNVQAGLAEQKEKKGEKT